MQNIKLPVFEDGIFKNLFLEFIDYKCSCGLKYDTLSIVHHLCRLNRLLNEQDRNVPILCQETVETFVSKKPGESASYQNVRAAIVRQFANYLQARGYEAYHYPIGVYRHNDSDFTPYIFSQEEMKAIFHTADNLSPARSSRHFQDTYPVLIRVLYGCGLRISEATGLKMQDVDLKAGTLFIELSKRGKSRLIPMSQSVKESLLNYMETVCKDRTHKEYIFLPPQGGTYSGSAVRTTIKNIYKKSGIVCFGTGKYPRVQDLRHTYAVHAMEKLNREGFDLYCCLPVISAYLGHTDIRDTEKYLHLPSFKMEDLSSCGEALVKGMIPEVAWDENS